MEALIIVLVIVVVLLLIGLAMSVRVIKQYEQGVLFRCVRPWPRGSPWRVQAERVATTVMAFAPAQARAVAEQAFAGATRAALA